MARSQAENTPNSGAQAEPVRCERIGFLLVPDFPLVPYATTIESLRMTNQLLGKQCYVWENLTLDGQPVAASCGLEVAPASARGSRPMSDYSMVFVVAGLSIRAAWSARLGKWLNRWAKEGVPLGALSTGAYLLAKSGLLDGYRATIHWEYFNATRESFPNVFFVDSLYEIDRDRYTCGGGTSALDLILQLITRQHGANIAQQICDQLMVDRLRDEKSRQKIPLSHQLGTSQPRLREAAQLMEANMEEPLSPDELASYVGVTRRQLERLFRTYLDCTPMQYYLGLRLDNARRLLIHTEKSILDISIACGFATAAHFSKCYRDRFGCAPRDDRRGK